MVQGSRSSCRSRVRGEGVRGYARTGVAIDRLQYFGRRLGVNGRLWCHAPLEPGIGGDFQDCRRRGKLVHGADGRQRHGDRGLRACLDRI